MTASCKKQGLGPRSPSRGSVSFVVMEEQELPLGKQSFSTPSAIRYWAGYRLRMPLLNRASKSDNITSPQEQAWKGH